MSGPNNKDDEDTTSVTSTTTNKSDEEVTNKENATPTPTSEASETKQPGSEVRVRVGGTMFVLDEDTLQKLNSEYLNAKVMAIKDVTLEDCVSPSKQQEQGNGSPREASLDESFVIVINEADTECFSSLIHMARFGSLPTSIFDKEHRELLLRQAEEIWGVKEQVEAALEKAREDFRTSCNCPEAIQLCLMANPMSTKPPATAYNYKAQSYAPGASVSTSSVSTRSTASSSIPSGATAVYLGGPHHNFRRDDGSRRVFCSSCGHRDIDWRYHIGDFYSNCQKCNKEITYKPDLGWCHKCRQCDSCQTSECPGVPIRQLEDQVIPYMIKSLKNNESELTFF